MIQRIAITLAASLALILGLSIGSANYNTAQADSSYSASAAAAAPAAATATNYTVNHYWAQESWAWVASYTDAGKNCVSGRKVLYEGDTRTGVTCIRSGWHIKATRYGASDGIWAPYQEVRIPSGGALVETFVG